MNREWWYSQPFVLHNLREQLEYKYLSSVKVKDGKRVLSRYYLGYSIPLLQQSLHKLSVTDPTNKLYFDLSYWKNDKGMTPMISFDTNQREKDKEKFNDNFNKYFVGFDFAIDLDSDDNVMTAWKDAKKIKELFDKYKLPYSLKFSGSRGFHFLIQDKWFNSRMKAKNKVILFGRMAGVIMGVCGLKSHEKGGTFDDSIYDDRRIFKLAYSLCNKNGKEYVCLPLNESQFNNFKLEKMELNHVLEKVTLFKRGLLTRMHNQTEKQLKKNVLKFLGEINGKSR